MVKLWRIECNTIFSQTLYQNDEKPVVCPIDGCSDFTCVEDF
jgi:hypothetical protein